MGLEGRNGIALRGIDEVENMRANPFNGIFLERDLLLIIVFLSGLLSGNLERLLDLEGLSSQLLGVLDGVADVDVVEEDVLSHGPELNTDTTDLGEGCDRLLVLEECGVGDLARGPLALVCRVVDHRSRPLATPERVDLERTLPFTATGRFSALGVGDSRRIPVTVFLVVPFLRLGGV